MIDFLVRIIAKWVLLLRYRISINGIEAIASKGKAKSVVGARCHSADCSETRRVIKLEEIPVLGTGKTNYRALKEAIGKS